jgi:iron complex outermembrane receptor protein
MFSFTNYYGLNCGRLEESLEYRDEEHGGLAYYIDANGNNIAASGSAGPNGETIHHDGVILEGVDPEGNPNTKIISAPDYYGSTFEWGPMGLYGNAVYDNSYIKFREASVGYNFDPSIVKKIGFQNLSISLIGRNLFYLWKTIPNIDPEASNGTGAARGAFEITASQPIRSIGFMLRASF